MDTRIVDLDSDNPIIPKFFSKNNTTNLTLCAGDGKQQGITDIEWFTTNKQGYNREKKTTTIFMTTKNYNPDSLEENKQYLIDNQKLQVILLVYDDKSLKYRENLCLLFKDSIDNIYEDTACYGKKLNLKILDCILREGGVYHMENYMPAILELINELYLFEDYYEKFEVDLDNNKIIKNNGNIIIANEKKNNQYNEAIKIFDNRKKLDEADKEKRREYRNRIRLSRKRYKTPSQPQSRKKYRSRSRSQSRKGVYKSFPNKSLT